MATEWTYDRNGKRYILDMDLIVADCIMCGKLCTQQKELISSYGSVRTTALIKDGKSFCECCFTLPQH